MTIKRIDRTKQLMEDLEKSASAGVREAAIMLKTIAREMVSRKYAKTTKQARRDAAAKAWNPAVIAAERDRARRYFISRPNTGTREARMEASFQKRLIAARRKSRS